MTRLLSVATPVPVSRLNSVPSCCACSAGEFQLFLGGVWLSAATQDDFSVSSWLAGLSLEQNIHLMVIVFCASSSCDEGEHVFTTCSLQTCPTHMSGQAVRKRDPERDVVASGCMVVGVLLGTRE